MQTRPEIAMRQVFTGQPKKIDLGVVVDGRGRREYWDNTFGIGFDATVTIRSRKIPILRGFFIYFISVLQTILLNHDAAHLQVKTDGESWVEDSLMLVLCNGAREGGGFFVAPGAKNDDGVLDYVGICRVSRPMMFRLLPEVMKGTHARFKQVRMGQFRQIELTSDRPLYIHIDGEIFAGFGTDVRQLSAEILPGALEVMV
jgi:diacylglycerol kinase family enzyme